LRELIFLKVTDRRYPTIHPKKENIEVNINIEISVIRAPPLTYGAQLISEKQFNITKAPNAPLTDARRLIAKDRSISKSDGDK